MKRLFTFGCSFTQYWRWPTWADALGQEFDFFENWGICGAGNSLILYSLIECHQRHGITADDVVYIMWTNTSREDRYVKNRWLADGNVYWWGENSKMLGEYVKTFACERGYLIRDLANITAAKELLEKWQCDWKFLSMTPLTATNSSSNLGGNFDRGVDADQDVRDLYRSSLESIAPSVYDIVFNQDWHSRPGIADIYDPRNRDFHPSPLEHLEYLDLVCPGMITKDSTVQWMTECEALAKTNSLNWAEPNRPKRF